MSEASQRSSLPELTHNRSYYHSLIINVLSALKDYTSTTPTSSIVQWRRDAALTIVQLIRTHQHLYGPAHMSIFLIQPITTAAFVLVDEQDPDPTLTPADAATAAPATTTTAPMTTTDSGSTPYAAELTDLCIFFRAMSRRWPFATAALRLLQLTITRRGRRLPRETDRLFDDFESREWAETGERRRQLQSLKSLYPVVADREDGKGQVRNMGEVLGMMRGFEVGDCDGGGEGGEEGAQGLSDSTANYAAAFEEVDGKGKGRDNGD